MFKNVLASIGIGGMKVDTIVSETTVEPGGRLSGTIGIVGGDVPQRIDAIELALVTRAIVETSGDNKVYGEVTVAVVRAADRMEVAPAQRLDLPFTLEVPPSAPLSIGPVHTALRTRLDVPMALDPRDSDAVRIVPDGAQRSVFEGMQRAGFRLGEVEVEYKPRRVPPFLQEFDFKPTSVRDWGVEEVEVAFLPRSGGGYEVLLTVDSRGGLFSRGLERGYRLAVPATGADPEDVAAAVRQAIGRR